MTRTRMGGRKKLVPAVSREAKCPHEYVDDDELRLEVECEGCHGPQDLANNRCLRGIVQVLCIGARPNVLILKRKTHKRYRDEPLALALKAASGLEALNRCLLVPRELSDKHCQTCHASMSWVMGALRRSFLDDPLGFVVDPDKALDRAVRSVAVTRCGRASECIHHAILEWRNSWKVP
ncbi:MAG: hypothetical protein JSV90_01435 [Methanobacteriota archaeon]|nr:MAG: hypothetical protein JSV90_01435 [Euryarchaeota archaeon]